MATYTEAVSDVFHTGSPDSALWEFKHGNGNFKRGDLIGLREIKRRASRHALIHRDSFAGHKASSSQPGTPAEPVPDATEARLMNLEHSLYDMHNRLARAEEGNAALTSKCQIMADSLSRCYLVSWAFFLPGRPGVVLSNSDHEVFSGPIRSLISFQL